MDKEHTEVPIHQIRCLKKKKHHRWYELDRNLDSIHMVWCHVRNGQVKAQAKQKNKTWNESVQSEWMWTFKILLALFNKLARWCKLYLLIKLMGWFFNQGNVPSPRMIKKISLNYNFLILNLLKFFYFKSVHHLVF